MVIANNLFYLQGYDRAKEGMSMIRPIELGVGNIIYRFYDSTRCSSPLDGASGLWWFEYEYFQKIKHFSELHGYSLGYAARLFAAILFEWSEVDSFVACAVKKPLGAWKGRGKQVLGTGKDHRDTPTMTPMQGVLEVYQLCVPGLGGQGLMMDQVFEVRKSGLA